jgi:hypothetical protein
LHGGSFQQCPIAVRPIDRALLIICQIAPPVCELAHTTPNFSTRRSSMSYFLKSPTSASSTEISPEKVNFARKLIVKSLIFEVNCLFERR